MTTSMKMVAPGRQSALLKIVPLVLGVMLSTIGLWFLVDSPVTGDDLTFVTFSGIGEIWSGTSTFEFIGFWVSQMIGGNHVTPINGLITSIQLLLTAVFADFGFSIPLIWGIFRILWIQIAILSLAFCIFSWFPIIVKRHKRDLNSFTFVYLLVSALAIGMLQLHVPNGMDPVFSYTTAGWATASFALVYCGLIGLIWTTSKSLKLKFAILSALVGIIGVLNYELMVAAMIGGGLLATGLLIFGEQAADIRKGHISYFAIAILTPFAIFLIAQIIRLNLPTWYDGTSIGYKELIIPVTLSGLVSLLPISNYVQLPPFMQESAFSMASFNWTVFGAVSALLALAVVVYRLRVFQAVAPKPRPNICLTITLVLGLGLMALISTVIIATSAKYQVDPGISIGRTYLNYPLGLMSLAGIIAISIVAIGTARPVWAFSLLVVFLIPITAVQWQINSQYSEWIESENYWNNDFFASLSGEFEEIERCSLALSLLDSDFSDRQKAAALQGMNSAYFARFKEDFCDSLPPLPRIGRSITLIDN